MGGFAFIMGLETLVPLSDAPSFGLKAGQPTWRRFTIVWRKDGVEAGAATLFWR
jgi:hypothetical protein